MTGDDLPAPGSNSTSKASCSAVSVPAGMEMARKAASAIGTFSRLKAENAVCGIVLGSGLGSLANRIDDAVRIPFSDIPGMPEAGVAGHAGQVIVGRLAERPIVAFAGRFHMYEGHSAQTAAFPARVLHALGIRVYFASNAAGGIRPDFSPGDLMMISDHINLMFRNPLIGRNEADTERFPDMSAAYDSELRSIIRSVARDHGIPLSEGTYCGLLGPCYETPAEVRMLGSLGADAVGMSTVPEVIMARALGMRVAAVSCITNKAAGLAHEPLSHSEVMAAGRSVSERFETLVIEFVRRLPGGES